MRVLENLEPKKVMYYFEEISAIPRGSKNEKQISDYVTKFAKDRGYETVQDEALNVIVKVPGTKGKENNPAVILQGHIDMVCEKDKDVEHDFLKEGIKLQIDGDYITGTGTTLGGDNGVACAYMLAIMDSDDIPHPPLEMVFTSDEETGMSGAYALDLSDLKGRILLNMDSEEEGIFLTSCAGGGRNEGRLKIETTKIKKDDYKGYEIEVTGLLGGHSGSEIIKERANSNLLGCRILRDIDAKFDAYLYDIVGGAMDNAIPREFVAKVMIKNEDVASVEALVKAIEVTLQKEFQLVDKDLKVNFKKVDCTDEVFTKEFTKKLYSVVLLLPNGVLHMSQVMDDLVETSNNVGVIVRKGDDMCVRCCTRSSVISRRDDVHGNIKLTYDTFGMDSTFEGLYPAWEYKVDSEIRPVFANAYEKLYGTKATFFAIHAGLECGVISEKIQGLDMISLGPNLFDVHSPKERLSISSTERVYKLVCAVLADM